MKSPVALPVLLYIFITGAALASAPELVTVNVQDTNINVYYYQPAGDGPFPLLVLSHGSPRSAEDRASYGSKTLHAQAEAYAANGVAVAVPIRRGYGGNGEWVEGYGNNKNPDFYVAGLTSAEDIEATIAAFSKRPEIDASRIVLMGVSAGGWASVAAGTKGGVLGVVSPENSQARKKSSEADGVTRYG
jgi:dipeptidyl aminopeptidase/acylaminoacyl peptidase